MNKMKLVFLFGLILSGLFGANYLNLANAKSDNNILTLVAPEPVLEGLDKVERVVANGAVSIEPIMIEDSVASIMPPSTVRGVSISGKGIHVTGHGMVRARPNIAIFTAGVVTTGKSAADATQKNAETMNQVLKSLKSLGIEDKDIKTQTVSVWPEYDYGYRDGTKRDLPIIIGYRAENRVTVTIRDISIAGKAIDSAVKAGSNQVYGLSYSFSEHMKDKLYAAALREAVDQGTGKAKVIADAIGAKEIMPIRVSESGGFYPPIYRMDMAEKSVGKDGIIPTPIEVGELEISASVSMSFDFV